MVIGYMMKILNSLLGSYCSFLETLSDMLVKCKTIHDLWVEGISCWSLQSGNSYTVDVPGKLYGYCPVEKKTGLLTIIFS